MSRCALILCGGFGSRFKPISKSPKILANFGNHKFIDWLINYLKKNNFTKIYFSIGFKGDEIKTYLKNKDYFIDLQFIEELDPLGTGGAVIYALNTTKENELVVFNGDTFWNKNIPNSFFEEEIQNFIILTQNTNKNERYGDFKVVDNQLTFQRGTVELPIINSDIFIGIARVSRNIINIELDTPFSFEDLVMKVRTGVSLVKYSGQMLDYGTPEAYKYLSNMKNV